MSAKKRKGKTTTPMTGLGQLDGLEDGERLLFAGLPALADGLSRFCRSVVRTAAIWTRKESIKVLDPYRLLQTVPIASSALEPPADPRGVQFDAGDRVAGCKRRFDEAEAGGIGTLCLIADAPPAIMRREHLTTWLRIGLEALAVDINATERHGAPILTGLASENLDRLARQVVAGGISGGGDQEIVDIYAVRCALDLAEELSLQREEGSRIEGAIVFPAKLSFDVPIQIEGLAEFNNVKLIGKLVMAGGGAHDLVAGVMTRVLGYRRRSERESTDLVLELTRTGEAIIQRNAAQHAVFKSGRLFGVSLESELDAVESVVRDFVRRMGGSETLPHFLTQLVASASGGCSVVIGSGAGRLGLRLDPPCSCNEPSTLDLVTSMSGVDGALSFGLDGSLLAFGCLLDGSATQGEVRARGSRFNSMVRYTAANPTALGVVVSADGLVSVIEGGKETYPLSSFRGWSVEDYLELELDLDVHDSSVLILDSGGTTPTST